MNKGIMEFIEAELPKGGGHGIDHAVRVYKYAKQILNSVVANEKVVLKAALLHDVMDQKLFTDVRVQEVKISNFLRAEGCSEDELSKIFYLIENTPHSKGVDLSANLEAQILADADRLDALGMIGIIRTIEYATINGRAFVESEDELDFFIKIFKQDNFCEIISNLPSRGQSESVLYHIHRKLLNLPKGFYTDCAKRISEPLMRSMYEFLERYYAEKQ